MSALAAKGFAVMGVNVPGTGCSSGSIYPPFSKAWAKDGAAAVLFNPTPAANTVWHDERHVSDWVFNTLPITSPVPPLPPCGSVLEEPCRTNAEPVPASTAR
jgi:hypothetical protein